MKDMFGRTTAIIRGGGWFTLRVRSLRAAGRDVAAVADFESTRGFRLWLQTTLDHRKRVP